MDTSAQTPYQGKNRCFGEYKCTRCNKVWKSAHSKANEYEICATCNNRVYPFKQTSLQSVYEVLRKNQKVRLESIRLASSQMTSWSS